MIESIKIRRFDFMAREIRFAVSAVLVLLGIIGTVRCTVESHLGIDLAGGVDPAEIPKPFSMDRSVVCWPSGPREATLQGVEKENILLVKLRRTPRGRRMIAEPVLNFFAPAFRGIPSWWRAYRRSTGHTATSCARSCAGAADFPAGDQFIYSPGGFELSRPSRAAIAHVSRHSSPWWTLLVLGMEQDLSLHPRRCYHRRVFADGYGGHLRPDPWKYPARKKKTFSEIDQPERQRIPEPVLVTSFTVSWR